MEITVPLSVDETFGIIGKAVVSLPEGNVMLLVFHDIYSNHSFARNAQIDYTYKYCELPEPHVIMRPKETRPADEKAWMYRIQDGLLISIERGLPLRADRLIKLPPHRAVLLAVIAEKAGAGLEKGTAEQLKAEAAAVGGNGKLGEWWLRS